ncbi:MAG: hypothetical protein IE889_07430 [Campylobacterales bacterium]|nr:hypothetical protein [Campylobacterales bacterium]
MARRLKKAKQFAFFFTALALRNYHPPKMASYNNITFVQEGVWMSRNYHPPKMASYTLFLGI